MRMSGTGRSDERGVALVMAMLVLLVLSIMAMIMMMNVTVNRQIAGMDLRGTQALTVQGTPIRRLSWKGHVVGSVWSDADADYYTSAGTAHIDADFPNVPDTYDASDSNGDTQSDHYRSLC